MHSSYSRISNPQLFSRNSKNRTGNTSLKICFYPSARRIQLFRAALGTHSEIAKDSYECEHYNILPACSMQNRFEGRAQRYRANQRQHAMLAAHSSIIRSRGWRFRVPTPSRANDFSRRSHIRGAAVRTRKGLISRVPKAFPAFRARPSARRPATRAASIMLVPRHITRHKLRR